MKRLIFLTLLAAVFVLITPAQNGGTGIMDIDSPNTLIKALNVNHSKVILNGTSQYYVVSDNDNIDFGTGDGFVSFSFYADDVSGTQYLFNKETGGVGYGLFLDNAQLEIRFDDGTTDIVDTLTTISATTWYHIAINFDRDGNATLYKDGDLAGTVDISSASLTVSNSGNLVFGASSALDSFFDGEIDDIRVYNRVLTASEIKNNNIKDDGLYNFGQPELAETKFADRGASQTELVTNGTFDADTDWTKTTGATITGGYGVLDGAVSANPQLYQNVVVTKNKVYRLDYEIIESIGSDSFVLYSDGGSTHIVSSSVTLSRVVGTHSTTLTSSGNARLSIRLLSSTDSLVVDNVSLTQIGEVASYDASNATSYSWIDNSGNNLHAQGSGSPTAVRSEKIGTIKQFKGSIAANTNTTLTSIIPKGYRIVAIRAQSDSALTAIKIGSSSGGEQVVASTTTTAGQSKILTLASTANDAYSESADVTLYARHDTGASGKTMNLIFILEKVNK